MAGDAVRATAAYLAKRCVSSRALRGGGGGATGAGNPGIYAILAPRLRNYDDWLTKVLSLRRDSDCMFTQSASSDIDGVEAQPQFASTRHSRKGRSLAGLKRQTEVLLTRGVGPGRCDCESGAVAGCLVSYTSPLVSALKGKVTLSAGED